MACRFRNGKEKCRREEKDHTSLEGPFRRYSLIYPPIIYEPPYNFTL